MGLPVAPHRKSRSRPRDDQKTQEGNNAGHQENTHHRKKSKKEKGEKKRKLSSDGSAASPRRASRSRKRRKLRVEVPEAKAQDAKDPGKAAVGEAKDAATQQAAPSQTSKTQVAGILAMRPVQLSKKTPKDALAEVKSAFGLSSEKPRDAMADVKSAFGLSSGEEKHAKVEKDKKDVAAAKESKEHRHGEAKDAKEHKEHKHGKHKDKKDGKDAKESKDSKSHKAAKESKETKDSKDSKDGATAADDQAKKKSKFTSEISTEKDAGASPKEGAAEAKPLAKGLAGLSGLGNIAELQKRIADEKVKLRMFVIKAKQEWAERAPQARGETNEQEYYMASEGEAFGPKREFRCEASIGRGVFSSVFAVKQTAGEEKDKSFAVKFVRSNHMMRKAAEKEVELYKRLAKQAPKEDNEASQFMMFLAGCETFTHNGHLAMVFELQKCDLRTAMQKYGQGKGLPLQTVAQYVRQIFLCLRLLRKLKVILGDLKPDNILMSLSKTEVKVCDFGSAMEVAEEVKTAYMQPRYYRAPEIIIGNAYDTQIDLWSAGVTLYELGTGKILFKGKNNNGMLRAMLDVCGEFPRRMTKEGAYGSKHFNEKGDLVHKTPDSMSGLPEILKMRDYQKPRVPISGLVEKVLKEPPPNADNKTQERLLPRLADLVSKCLRIDQNERFTPEHALAHNFFKKDR